MIDIFYITQNNALVSESEMPLLKLLLKKKTEHIKFPGQKQTEVSDEASNFPNQSSAAESQ